MINGESLIFHYAMFALFVIALLAFIVWIADNLIETYTEYLKESRPEFVAELQIKALEKENKRLREELEK